MIKRPDDMKSEERAEMRGGTGTVGIMHLVNSDEFTARTRLCARLTLPPGASIGLHQHDGEDEVYIITKGTGSLDEGGGPVRVESGDTILTGNGQSHSIENDGDSDLEIIAVIMTY